MAAKYKTVADELLEFADVVKAHFESLGFTVKTELYELGFPYTPTFLLKRRPTIIIVELTDRIQMDRVVDWTKYGKSCDSDTRVAVCVPHTTNLSPVEIGRLQQHNAGLYLVFNDRVVEQIAPPDLGLNVELPQAATLSRQVRQLLGSAYEQFGRGQWREGFEEACQVLKVEARRYLKKWSKTGRIKILKKGLPVTLTPKEINKFTMGQLAEKFSQIQAQNHADSVIQKTLAAINKDRVGVAHHKKKAVTEKRLRANVGRHMWVIVAALKVLTT